MVMRLDWFVLPLFLSRSSCLHILRVTPRFGHDQATPHRLPDLLGFEGYKVHSYGTLGGMKLALDSILVFATDY